MLFNPILKKALTQKDRELWVKVMDTMMHLTDYLFIIPSPHNVFFECHSICRAFGWHIPELKIVDGIYVGIPPNFPKNTIAYECDHSWLTTPDGTIIDPYPVGFLCTHPIIIPTTKYLAFGKEFYIHRESTTHEVMTRKIGRRSAVLFRFIQEAERKLQRK